MSAAAVPALFALSLIGGAVMAGPAGAGARPLAGQSRAHPSAGRFGPDDLEPPTITSPDSTTFTVGQAGLFTVETTPGDDQNGDGLVALYEAGDLPDDVTFTDNGDGTATLAGTPLDGTDGSYTITITASNGVEPDATQDFTLTVDPSQVAPVTVTITGPGSINEEAPYAATASAPGAVPSPTYTLASGAPSWLSVDPDSGDVAGTPPLGTTSFGYQVTATNGAGSATSNVQSITVVEAPTSVTVSGPDSQVVGTTYEATSTSSGADVAPTYSLASGAPSWLTIDPSSGDISGIIPEGNPPFYGYSVTATDSDGSATSAEQFVEIDPGSTEVTMQISPPGPVAVNTPVTFTATVSETDGSGALSGDLSFTEGTGTKVSNCTDLPLVHHAASCTITFPSTGNIDVTANYKDDAFFNGSSASVLEQVVNANAPQFTSPPNTTTAVGTSFVFNVSATGNPEPTIAESGTLPSGVTFKAGPAGSGTISGTPEAGAGGSYPITLTATSSGGSTNQPFTLTVDEAPAITSASSSTGTVGTALSFKVKTTGYPSATVTESGSLPSGVQFKAKAGGSATISGTPGQGTAGPYPLTLTAANGIGSPSTQDFVLTVNQGLLFTSPSSTAVPVGTSFDFAVSASGSPEPKITETGSLPTGVSFESGPPGSASLSGSPAAHTEGIYAITFKAKGSGETITQSFTLTVDEAPVITSAASANATLGDAFSFKVKSTGFPTPTVSESGLLPVGVTFTAKSNGTATISGTPQSAGSYDITIGASNGVGSPATQPFVLTVSG